MKVRRKWWIGVYGYETHTMSASKLDDCGARHEAVYEGVLVVQ